MAAKKIASDSPGKPAKRFGHKTKFVLSLPQKLSAKQVVAEAKRVGIALGESHVHNIRSMAKRKARTTGELPLPGTRPRAAARANASTAAFANHEALLIDAAIHVGLNKATHLLARLRARAGSGL